MHIIFQKWLFLISNSLIYFYYFCFNHIFMVSKYWTQNFIFLFCWAQDNEKWKFHYHSYVEIVMYVSSENDILLTGREQ